MDTQEKVSWIYHRRYLYVIFAVFVFFLITTFFAWKITSDVAQQESKDRFYQDSLNIQSLVQIKLNLYILGAEGLAGYVETNGGVKRDEWSAYIKKARLIEDYPGISSLFYIEKVKSADKKAFIENVRKDTSLDPKGYPNFNIYPETEKKEYFVAKYVEPVKGREKALGFDISSEGKRLQALEIARDSGKISSTGKIISSSSGMSAFGFLLPIYKNGTDLNNLEEKRANVIGFVNAGFRGDELFKVVYGKTDLFPGVDFEIYDSKDLLEKNLLYDHDPDYKASDLEKNNMTSLDNIKVDGDTWTLVIAAKPSYKLSFSQELLPSIVLASGLIFSFITLCVFLWTLKKHVRQHKIQKLPDSNLEKKMSPKT